MRESRSAEAISTVGSTFSSRSTSPDPDAKEIKNIYVDCKLHYLTGFPQCARFPQGGCSHDRGPPSVIIDVNHFRIQMKSPSVLAKVACIIPQKLYHRLTRRIPASCHLKSTILRLLLPENPTLKLVVDLLLSQPLFRETVPVVKGFSILVATQLHQQNLVRESHSKFRTRGNHPRANLM